MAQLYSMPQWSAAEGEAIRAMSRNREVLQQSIALAAEGRAGAAITKLASAVKSAGRAKDPVWVAQLAKNLALLYAEQNKLPDAAKYYDIALRASKSDPTLHLAIADVYQQLGKHSMARRHLKTCHALAIRANDRYVLEILDVHGYSPTGDTR
jgi:tetratricopeptide (TPR) repeat protein